MAKTKATKKKAPVAKEYIVQYETDGSWWQSSNIGASQAFSTLAKAQEAKSHIGLKYRAAQVSVKA